MKQHKKSNTSSLGVGKAVASFSPIFLHEAQHQEDTYFEYYSEKYFLSRVVTDAILAEEKRIGRPLAFDKWMLNKIIFNDILRREANTQ